MMGKTRDEKLQMVGSMHTIIDERTNHVIAEDVHLIDVRPIICAWLRDPEANILPLHKKDPYAYPDYRVQDAVGRDIIFVKSSRYSAQSLNEYLAYAEV